MRQLDQLNEYDLAFIENKQSKFFVQLFEKVDGEQKSHYSKRLEYLPKGMKELLSNMLQFNPYLRYSARECLEMQMFGDLQELTPGVRRVVIDSLVGLFPAEKSGEESVASQ